MSEMTIPEDKLREMVKDLLEKDKPATSWGENQFAHVDDLREAAAHISSIPEGDEDTKHKASVDFMHAVFARDGYIDSKSAWEKREDNRYHILRDFVMAEGREKSMLKDLMTSENARILTTEVMSRVLREPTEPMLAGLALSTRVNIPEGVTQISFPAIGGVQAYPVSEAHEYFEESLAFAGKGLATIGKYGVKFAFSEEVLRMSAFDLIALSLKAGRAALDRLKEQNIWDKVNEFAGVSFDNAASPTTTPVNGNTTGRGNDAVFNNTIAIDDIMVMYADLINAGYIPDTIATNPQGWFTMARNPVFRAYGFQNGQALFQSLQGAPGRRPTLWEGANPGPKAGQSATAANPAASTFSTVPFMPFGLRPVVSPFINFDATNSVTDIYLFDSSTFCGLAVAEDPRVMEWDDMGRDIKNVKLRERYGVMVLEEGAGIVKAKNVKTNVRSYDIDDVIRFDVGQTTMPTGWTGI